MACPAFRLTRGGLVSISLSSGTRPLGLTSRSSSGFSYGSTSIYTCTRGQSDRAGSMLSEQKGRSMGQRVKVGRLQYVFGRSGEPDRLPCMLRSAR